MTSYDKPFTYPDIESYINITGANFDREEVTLLKELSEQYLSDINRFGGDKPDPLHDDKVVQSVEDQFMSFAVER